MKRMVFFIGLLGLMLGGLNLSAAPVSAERALDLAGRILPAAKTRAAVEPLKVIWDGEVAATPQAPALYVIGRESGGFVILAGDDRVYPVLAISDSEVFRVEGMPANVRWWMERMKAYVRSVQTPEDRAVAAWSAKTRADASLPEGEVTNKVERLTPTWDQGNNDMYHFGRYVFNAMCPGSGYCPTGCVATSLGEVLTYESGLAGITMPESAHGTITGEEYVDRFPGGYAPSLPYELGTTYLWEGLRTLTDVPAINAAISAGQTALIDNLGQLLADLGAMVHAGYGPQGTSADLVHTLQYLILHLDINKRVYAESESSYSLRNWVIKLKAELDQRPVFYSGSDPEKGGHQFVLDGYGSFGDETVFHVNFGWAGSCNGYYRLTRLDSGDNGDYSYDCYAIFDFYPDANSTFIPRLSYDSITFNSGPTVNGLYVGGAVSAGQYFLLYWAVSNEGAAPYSGTLRVVQENKGGSLVGQPLHTESNYSIDPGIISGMGRSCRCNTITFGDKIVLQYASDQFSGGWADVKSLNDGSLICEWPLMPAAFIRTEASYAVGDYFTFSLKNIDTLYAGTVWTVTAPNGVKTVYQQADKEFCLTQAGKYKIDAAIAPTVGGDVTEHVVAVINVQ